MLSVWGTDRDFSFPSRVAISPCVHPLVRGTMYARPTKSSQIVVYEFPSSSMISRSNNQKIAICPGLTTKQEHDMQVFQPRIAISHYLSTRQLMTSFFRVSLSHACFLPTRLFQICMLCSIPLSFNTNKADDTNGQRALAHTMALSVWTRDEKNLYVILLYRTVHFCSRSLHHKKTFW